MSQLTDPIHHPQFARILRILRFKDVGCRVHNASSHKPEKAFIECLKPDATYYDYGYRWIVRRKS